MFSAATEVLYSSTSHQYNVIASSIAGTANANKRAAGFKKKTQHINKQHEGQEGPLGFGDLCIGFNNSA